VIKGRLQLSIDYICLFKVAYNVVCVYLVLAFKIRQLANICFSLKINGSNFILQLALNKHIVLVAQLTSVNKDS
jgi:hypothetical protein